MLSVVANISDHNVSNTIVCFKFLTRRGISIGEISTDSNSDFQVQIKIEVFFQERSAGLKHRIRIRIFERMVTGDR